MRKQIIGRREKIDFPDLGLFNVAAKIDTGAYSSTLHVFEVEEIVDNGIKKLRCFFFPKGHLQWTENGHLFEKYQRKWVKSSNGEAEERFLVRLTLLLFGEKIVSDFTLSNRSNLKYPVLLGRKLLRGRFLVDVSLKYQAHNK